MKLFLLVLILFAFSAQAAMAAVKHETITYKAGEVPCKGYLAYDDSIKGKRPGILVVHEWWGLNDYARSRADQLAAMGYVAFACDMYGEGKTTDHPKEAGEMAGAVRQNADNWLLRARAGLDILTHHERVDNTKLAAIGYCFGGSTALTLVHHGAPLAAVVSFHGALPIPTAEQLKGIKTRILICHGALDTFIPEKTIQSVREVYEIAKIDYQLVYYGGAVHSFTVPNADRHKIPGISYNEAADRRSWQDMKALFQEAFGETR